MSRVLNEPLLRPPTDQQEERRVDDVELLLDAERPVVQERRRRCLGNEVIRMNSLEMDIGEKERGPLTVDCRLVAYQGPERVICDENGDDDDESRCRNNAPGSSPVEAAEGCVARPLAFAQQQPSNDEPRDDEEDLDADVASAEPWYACVVHESQEDGNGAHPLYVGPELPITGRGSRFVPGRRVAIGRD